MSEIAGRELRAHAAQEVDELGALESPLDVDLAEAKYLCAAIERFLLDHRPLHTSPRVLSAAMSRGAFGLRRQGCARCVDVRIAGWTSLRDLRLLQGGTCRLSSPRSSLRHSKRGGEPDGKRQPDEELRARESGHAPLRRHDFPPVFFAGAGEGVAVGAGLGVGVVTAAGE